MINFCNWKDPLTLEQLYLNLGCSKQQIKKYLNKGNRSQIIAPRVELELEIDLINHREINPIYCGPDIPIIYHDQNFLVVNKPIEIHSTVHRYSDKNCVHNYLYHKGLYRPLRVNRHSNNRGVLHRLDQKTSGVLIFANNENSYKIRETFNENCREKIYWGLIIGKYTGDQVLRNGLRSSDKVVKIDPSQVLQTITISRTCYDSSLNISWLEIQLKEGFRHQIRAQLAAAGFPLIGDDLYGGRKYHRLALHCYNYQLNFNGQEYCFTAKD